MRGSRRESQGGQGQTRLGAQLDTTVDGGAAEGVPTSFGPSCPVSLGLIFSLAPRFDIRLGVCHQHRAKCLDLQPSGLAGRQAGHSVACVQAP